jgi:deoxyribose-phosphate aldolase
MPATSLARAIDHTLLRPDALSAEVDTLCEEALRFDFFAVCVQPCFAARAARALTGSHIRVATVAAFPHGAATTATKIAETRRARDDGAHEIDVVANLGWIRAGETAALRDELAAIVEAARPALVKVILETALFTADLLRPAAGAAIEAGAAFLKTSTGFSSGGATVESVRLLRELAGPSVGVKASGGIRSREAAEAMIAAGATRIGCSASVAIVSA